MHALLERPFPASLDALRELALNLWWSWDEEATALMAGLDPHRWDQVGHNPVAVLMDIGERRLRALGEDEAFVARVASIHERFRAYLDDTDTWAHRNGKRGAVAYLSMEFGLHESVRLYSGGLGVLAGDHVRSASDLGLDFTGVSLLWRSGYFRQLVDDAQQVAAYPRYDFDRLPVAPLRDEHGAHVCVRVPHGRHTYLARVWTLAVGRVQLLLLDTDHDDNSYEHRIFTLQLYGGDERTRCAQEVLLGIGGVRALRAAGKQPDVVHLNEGHCAFAPIELIRERVACGDSFAQALSRVRQQVVFTTHTPVPAGHDRFSWDVVNEALVGYREGCDWPPGTFMDLGRVNPHQLHEPLCMTVLALRLSRGANGVSKLHGEVSREMWKELYPDRPVSQVPIGHITNGVHPTFWMAPETRTFLDEHVAGWRNELTNPAFWTDAMMNLDDKAFWDHHCRLRYKLIERARRWSSRMALDADALTIGFARRFAPYKRANLLFSDVDRLHNLLGQGVQLVYAGKAHPRDLHGQALMSEIVRYSDRSSFRDHVLFLENYNIFLGGLMTQGVDVWLNNPRRPREASGTSGQKVCLNGGINLSVLDGWWPEAYEGDNGWAIGEDRDYGSNVELQDAEDAQSLYRVLEEEVLPLFRDRDSRGVPVGWVRRMKRCMETCLPVFNTHRMVQDYASELYFPG